MPRINIVKPTDQPEGKNRLLAELKSNLQDGRFDSFLFIVAFAKLSPLLKLQEEILEWRKSRSIEAVFGVDQKGTSKEALQFAMEHFNVSFVMHVKGKFTPTFHPKIYLFKGKYHAIAYIGSNNLTVGGTETNFESYVKIEMDLPSDVDVLKEVLESWDKCLESSIKLDPTYFDKLAANDLIVSEKEMKSNDKKRVPKEIEETENDNYINFPIISVKPASPLPKNILVSGLNKRTVVVNDKKEKVVEVEREDVPVSTLLMHIIPHHNGEILLSMNAVNQNKSFFGWPFTGSTIPKKSSNPAYPQKEPDPVVDILLYDENADLIFVAEKFGLNTVYYESRSELRITVPMEIFRHSSQYVDGPYPILVIKNEDIPESLDYKIEIYLPGSEQYNNYETSCNQSMPSGGKTIARKFGWL